MSDDLLERVKQAQAEHPCPHCSNPACYFEAEHRSDRVAALVPELVAEVVRLRRQLAESNPGGGGKVTVSTNGAITPRPRSGWRDAMAGVRGERRYRRDRCRLAPVAHHPSPVVHAGNQPVSEGAEAVIEMYGPIPLSLVEWWDRQIRIGLGVYFNALNTAHRQWQEMVGLR